MTLRHRLRPAAIVSVCVRTWRWYRGELAALARPVTRRFRTGGQVVVRVGADGEPLVPAGTGVHDGEIVLEIPATEFLHRSITLPAAARRHLTAILLNDLDRLSPLRPEIVYASYHLVERNNANGTLTVELRLIRREWLDAVLGACIRAGLPPARLRFEDGLPARRGRLPRLSLPPLSLRLTRAACITLLGALPVELAFIAFMNMQHQDAELELVLAETAKTRIEAQAVERTKAAAAALRSSLDGLMREKQAYRPGRLIAALSDTIPFDSWAFGLRIEGEQIRLSGFSRSATTLLSTIENSPVFRNAQFRSPVVRNGQDDRERFEISFETEESP